MMRMTTTTMMMRTQIKALSIERTRTRTPRPLGQSFVSRTVRSGGPFLINTDKKTNLDIIRTMSSTSDVEAAASTNADVSKLDIRVGTILSAEDHPEADSLYVEQIDLGEEEGPRTIVSGLKKYVSLDEIQGKKVVVLANLKARNMRGVKSHGMLLCASNADHTEVEPLSAPADAVNGERVYFGDNSEQGEAALPNQLQKKKFWEACQPLLKTDASGLATCGDDASNKMMTSAGPVKATKLFNASIS